MEAAFLGMGIMGSRMAANLAKGGHRVRVWSRSSAKAEELAASGCVVAASVAEAVRGAEVVFTMVSDPPAVEALSHELLASMDPGCIWVDSSTIGPEASKDMASRARSRGMRFLDAPVSGSLGLAASAKLIFQVGGDAADIEAVRPAFQCMGSHVVHAGSVGSGSALKLVTNLLMAQELSAWAESLRLAEALGLDPDMVQDAILPSAVAPAFLGFKRRKIQEADWSPEFPLKHAVKDLRLALGLAEANGLTLSQGRVAASLYERALDAGKGDLDLSVVFESVGNAART
ncbi:MAG: NAD(P)-dependent oxidoreductase [Fibrobacteria bacterium]|nr:NAD(P)-dependent oxidoreductase [Fibrobacteria bacterium]